MQWSHHVLTPLVIFNKKKTQMTGSRTVLMDTVSIGQSIPKKEVKDFLSWQPSRIVYMT